METSDAQLKQLRIAVVGASGFIGLRAVEALVAKGAQVRPIVRAPSSLAVLARNCLEWSVCNFLDADSLSKALQSCDVCIHAAIGDPGQIVDMARVAYGACAQAGVRRLVWLSSASVHGQNPMHGTDECAVLHDRHPLLYNNAKVRAEWRLDRLSKDRRVEVVKLRPGVVFGPRSRWITDAAEELLTGRAGWINGGKGICNSIFVDNLVQAMELAAFHPNARGETFLVGDAETVTWQEFLLPIAEHLGFDASRFSKREIPQYSPERERILTRISMSPAYGNISARVPHRAKRVIKALIGAWATPPEAPSTWKLRPNGQAQCSHEMALLQQCDWKLPHTKAERLLGYAPKITFADAQKRTLSWLSSIGMHSVHIACR